MSQRLFGTDGIRGEIVSPNTSEKAALVALHEERSVCPTLLRLVGESLGHLIDTLPGEGELVVIGWDERPGNKDLVAGITLGLRLAGCQVMHIGICATPALHYAVLWHNARIGCMMTASHNPASDSGIKVFDANGYKTTPELEDRITSIAYALSEEEREVDLIDVEELSQPSEKCELDWASKYHPEWLQTRFSLFKQLFDVKNPDFEFLAQPMLLDCSRGAGTSWLAEWLNTNGISAREISHEAEQLNADCGAGDFSPTATWTFEEAAASNHLLLRQLTPAQPGIVVAAALDGDGDRCLLIESTTTGFRIIDGDAIGDTVVVAGHRSSHSWKVAASIESDLALLSSLTRLSLGSIAYETAVGDRWLSHALRSSLMDFEEIPTLIGIEDSGHAVLPSPHPNQEGVWSLVGDGAATLVSYLLARSVANSDNFMEHGWKMRSSVKDVNRSLWNGQNKLADEIEIQTRSHFEQCGVVSNWTRKRLEGEPNLMLIEAHIDGKLASLGVRNSGTQAKISVSLRLAAGMNHQEIASVIPFLTETLSKAMK